jgi:hypothetical protein
MKTFKSKKITGRHDVFVSEVNLKSANASRIAKVRKLFRLIGEEAHEPAIL